MHMYTRRGEEVQQQQQQQRRRRRPNAEGHRHGVVELQTTAESRCVCVFVCVLVASAAAAFNPYDDDDDNHNRGEVQETLPGNYSERLYDNVIFHERYTTQHAKYRCYTLGNVNGYYEPKKNENKKKNTGNYSVSGRSKTRCN